MPRRISASIRVETFVFVWGLGVTLSACEGSVDGNIATGVEGVSAGSGNLLQNGSFEAGLSPWGFLVRGGAAATQTQTTHGSENGAYSERVNITTATPSTPWNVQISQAGIALTAGAPVTVSLWAKASAPRDILSIVQQDVGPWTEYASQTMSLGTSWANYSFTFTPSTNDPSALFDLNLAGAAGRVWIDNVSLTAGPTPCNPTTCEAHGADCGAIPDGCGGTLDCGVCAAPETCGGAGTPNVCGQVASIGLPPPPGFTASQRVFDDTFQGATLDASKWNSYITSNAARGWPWFDNGAGGSAIGPAGSFDAEYMAPGQLSIADGLTISATRGSTQQGYSWTSGAITSYGKFEFTGGYLQIGMQAAQGNGAWPGLWMLPGKGAGASGDNFEIDLQEGGFTGNAVNADDNAAWHEHTGGGTCGGVTNTGVDLTAAFHTYGVRWIPAQSLTFFVDGAQQGQITSAECPISAEPMEIIIDLAVANSTAAGWHTAYDSSTPSPLSMRVSEVQVYQ